MKKKLSILAGSLAFCTLCSLAPAEKSVHMTDVVFTPEMAQAASTSKASSTLSAKQVYNKITANLEFPAQTDINADMFKDLYKINRAYIKSYQIKMPMISVHSNEIAIFQVKHQKYMNKVLSQVQKRLKTIQTNAFYPEQITLAKKGKVVTKGNYILLVVDQNASKIIDTFKKTVK